MLAAAIDIDAVAETNIGAVVGGDDRLRFVGQEFGGHRALRGQQIVVGSKLVEVGFEMHRFESVRRLRGCAAADNLLLRFAGHAAP